MNKNDLLITIDRDVGRVNGVRARGWFTRAWVVFVVLAVLLLAGPIFTSTAHAADTFVFAGRGNGHGAGMSQWGAWQGAREGYTFAEILAFYYPGATLEAAAEPDTVLKVRISSRPWTSNTTSFSQVDLEPTVSAATLYTAPDGETQEIPPGTVVTAVNAGGRVQVNIDGEGWGPYDYVELRPEGSDASEGRVRVGLTTPDGSQVDPREYWGTVRVQYGDDPGELWVYNYVAVEKYVRSIAEVEYDWATAGGDFYAPEAVKAQAVASRSYALAKNGTLADNWADQCYRGYTFEAKYPGIAQAAEDTAGLILTYAGGPITAFFSGHSGGYTTDSAWSGAMPPYIVAQADPWSLRAPPAGTPNGPGWAWTYTVSADSLSAKVNGRLRDISGETVDVGLISDVEVAGRDTTEAGSHARTLRITGAGGTATVSVSSFRSLLGTSNLPSTLIVSINGDVGAGDPGTGSDPGGDGGGTGDGDEGEDGRTGDGPATPPEFLDVGPGHLYHDQIMLVVSAGVMSGYGNGRFNPEGPVTRAQFAKIAVSLHNALHPDDPIEVVDVGTRPFADVAVDSKTTGDASDWIAAAKQAGLVLGIASDGSPVRFYPDSVIRRDQMASMICRALGWEDEARALPLDTPGFSDVSPGSVHWAAATYLKTGGILLGYYADAPGASSVSLRAEEPIMRQHVAVILSRVLSRVLEAD
ncbi:MAG: S-layer homology domain-containing protein [Actinomycetia bacterium]|nr:S-layer homology domain-containing protein [Actinomycetes bacterium]